MWNIFRATVVVVSLAVVALSLGIVRADEHDSEFVQTNLVSDISGLAKITEPQLINPWGVSHSPTSPLWVSDQGTNTSHLFSITDSATVTEAGLTVGVAGGPTGQVNNGNTSTTAFLVGNGGDGKPAHFIFADLKGNILAWDTGSTAFVQVTTSGAVYTGLTINGAQTQLYAANGGGTGSINVFNTAFAQVSEPAGAFTDPWLPSGFVPFNVEDIGGDIYVAYAPAGHPSQTSAPLGAGFIAIFDETGNFIKQLIARGHLAAPWGMTLAPPSFGRFGGALLVGNFSYDHSEINAFDPTNGKFLGTIHIDVGNNPPGGLWTLAFGVGGNNGSPDTLYVTDGINSEKDGLVAAFSPEKEPPKHCGDCDRDGDDQ